MVKEYLKTKYKYDEQELGHLVIEETKVTMKEDIFVYIVVKDIDDIKDIYRRKSEIRRDDVVLRTYVPPQFYGRFVELNIICKERRIENTSEIWSKRLRSAHKKKRK